MEDNLRKIFTMRDLIRDCDKSINDLMEYIISLGEGPLEISEDDLGELRYKSELCMARQWKSKRFFYNHLATEQEKEFINRPEIKDQLEQAMKILE